MTKLPVNFTERGISSKMLIQETFPEYLSINLLYLLSKSESVKFSLIESVIYFFTNSSVENYFSLLNQFIFTDSSVKAR